ncbi:MAG: hypothetical protein RLZZ419_1142 [Pseudomonadota bacterium]
MDTYIFKPLQSVALSCIRMLPQCGYKRIHIIGLMSTGLYRHNLPLAIDFV